MKEFNVSFFISVFTKRWRSIFIAALLGAVLAGGYCKFILPPVFRSSISIYFGKVTAQEYSGENSANKDQGRDLSLGMQMIADYREFINTDFFKESVMKRLGGDNTIPPCSYNVDVNWLNQTRIMRIDIQCDSPAQTQRLADAYGMVFIHDLRDIVGIQNAQIISESVTATNNSARMMVWFLAGGFFWGAILWWIVCGIKIYKNPSLSDNPVWSEISSIPLLGEFSTADKKAHSLLLKTLLANILVRPDSSGKTILFTGLGVDQLKCLLAAPLSKMLADTGRKTLFIDCGKLDSSNGKKAISLSPQSLAEAIKKHPESDRLDVLAIGAGNGDGNDICLTRAFSELIETCRKQYDIIIINTDDCSKNIDAVVVAASCDLAFIVAAKKTTSIEIFDRATALLQQAGVKMAGAILIRR